MSRALVNGAGQASLDHGGAVRLGEVGESCCCGPGVFVPFDSCAVINGEPGLEPPTIYVEANLARCDPACVIDGGRVVLVNDPARGLNACYVARATNPVQPNPCSGGVLPVLMPLPPDVPEASVYRTAFPAVCQPTDATCAGCLPTGTGECCIGPRPVTGARCVACPPNADGTYPVECGEEAIIAQEWFVRADMLEFDPLGQVVAGCRHGETLTEGSAFLRAAWRMRCRLDEFGFRAIDVTLLSATCTVAVTLAECWAGERADQLGVPLSGAYSGAAAGLPPGPWDLSGLGPALRFPHRFVLQCGALEFGQPGPLPPPPMFQNSFTPPVYTAGDFEGDPCSKTINFDSGFRHDVGSAYNANGCTAGEAGGAVTCVSSGSLPGYYLGSLEWRTSWRYTPLIRCRDGSPQGGLAAFLQDLWR